MKDQPIFLKLFSSTIIQVNKFQIRIKFKKQNEIYFLTDVHPQNEC